MVYLLRCFKHGKMTQPMRFGTGMQIVLLLHFQLWTCLLIPFEVVDTLWKYFSVTRKHCNTVTVTKYRCGSGCLIVLHPKVEFKSNSTASKSHSPFLGSWEAVQRTLMIYFLHRTSCQKFVPAWGRAEANGRRCCQRCCRCGHSREGSGAGLAAPPCWVAAGHGHQAPGAGPPGVSSLLLQGAGSASFIQDSYAKWNLLFGSLSIALLPTHKDLLSGMMPSWSSPWNGTPPYRLGTNYSSSYLALRKENFSSHFFVFAPVAFSPLRTRLYVLKL